MGKLRGILLIILSFALIFLRTEVFSWPPVEFGDNFPYVYLAWFIAAFVIGAWGVFELFRRPRRVYG